MIRSKKGDGWKGIYVISLLAILILVVLIGVVWAGASAERIKPVTPDNYTQWDTQTGCASNAHYDCVDEDTADDATSNIQTSTNSEYAMFNTNASFSSSEPRNVTVYAEVCKDGNPGAGIQICVNVSGTIGCSSSINPSRCATAYATESNFWDVSPATSSEWTEAEVNSMTIGVLSIDATPALNVTQVYAEVGWEDPVGNNPPDAVDYEFLAWGNDSWNTTTLSEANSKIIEKFFIYYNISDPDGDQITTTRFFFRNTNGSVEDSCNAAYNSSIGTSGNLDDDSCYNWLEFTNGTDTTTMSGGTSIGDGIAYFNMSGNNSFWQLRFEIDEVYKPVRKHYPYNGSNVRYSDQEAGNTGEVYNDTFRMFKFDGDGETHINIPNDADIYHVDFRGNYSDIGQSEKGMHVHMCNATYVSGDIHTSSNCVVLDTINSSDVNPSDDTKYRITFGVDTITALGNISDASVIFMSPEQTNSSRYWMFSQSDNTTSEADNHTFYSMDNGTTWIATQGYQDLININWLYDATTCFQSFMEVNDSNGNIQNTSVNEECWSSLENDPVGAPEIIAPDPNETISSSYNIQWIAATDPEGDNFLYNISLLNVDLSFNKTIAASINKGTNLYNWDTTGETNGDYYIRLEVCENETAELYCSSHTMDGNFTILNDNAPYWSANTSDIPTTYDSSYLSGFNITWEDETSVSTVLLEGNWSTCSSNCTMNIASGSIYNYNETLPAGTYYWKSYANDSTDQWNTSDTWIFTINKASTNITLWLNDTQADMNYTQGDIGNFTTEINVTGLPISLISNYTGWTQQDGTTSIINYTTLAVTGNYWNMTANYSATQNYSSSVTTWHFNVSLECTDSDSDGFNTTASATCGAANEIDCDDGNSTLAPLEEGVVNTITAHRTLCSRRNHNVANTVVNITSSDVIFDGNYSQIEGSSTQILISTADNVTLKRFNISSTGLRALSVTNSNGSTLENLLIESTGFGVIFTNVNYSVLNDSEVIDITNAAGEGLQMYLSDYNTFGNNNFTTTMTFNRPAFQVFDTSSFNTFVDNYFNGDYGVTISESGTVNNTFRNNTFESSCVGCEGLQISYSNNNTIINNTFDITAGDVLVIQASSVTADADGNIIANNTMNLANDTTTYYVIRLDSDASKDVMNTSIYNNIINRTGGSADTVITDNTLNYWNTTEATATNIIGGATIGGNWYSDYTGCDSDGDGIGETTYAIGGGDIDYLPLISTSCAAPYWYTNQSSTPTTYSNTTLSQFNVTWNVTEGDIDTVLIEGNWSGCSSNCTMTNTTYGNAIYNWSQVLPAGTWSWKSYANSTNGGWNSTDTWIFTINKASTNITLWLNDTQDNTTYSQYEIGNFTAQINVTGESVSLISNYTGWQTQTSTTTVTNTTNLTVGGNYWNMTANYSATQNYSSSVTTWHFNVTVADNPPYWSTNQSSTPSTYDPNTLSQFNITWNDDNDISIVYLEGNWSGCSSNCTMTNATYGGSIYNWSQVLPAGTYYWKSYANDTQDAWNTSDTWYFTIANGSNPVDLWLNTTQNANKTYTYPEWINATGNASLGAQLYRDSVLVSGDNEIVRLGNATYEYHVNATGNANYSANTTGLTYYTFINRGTVNINLSLNSTEANKTYIYPEVVYAKGNISSTIDNEGNLSLWRDGVIVNTSLTLTEVSEIILLGVGEYNYSLTYTATNYTDISILADRFADVTQGATSISLYLNGSEADTSYTQYQIANFTASLNVSGITVSLLSNYTGWVQQNGVTPLVNTTNLTTTGTFWNMTANFSGNTNYTSSVATWHFNVTSVPTDTDAPTIVWEDPTPPDNNVTNNTWVYLNTTITDASDTSALFDWNHSLKAYYSMEYSNATGLFDNSSYNGFGTFEGVVGESNLTSSVYGQGIDLTDDPGDYIEIGDHGGALNITGNLTIEAWVYRYGGSIQTWGTVISKGNGLGSNVQYEMEVYTGTSKVLFAINSVTGDNYIISDIAVKDQGWSYIAGIYNGTHLFVYVDGTEKISSTSASSINPTTSMKPRIGGAWGYFNGTIDEVKIYDRALSYQEINASMNNSLYRLENNFTDLSSGIYDYSACAIDTNGNLNCTAERSVNITAAAEADNPPYWSVNQSSTPATYDPTTYSEFNITWEDETSVSVVFIEGNWSACASNCTMTNTTYGGAIYNWTQVLPAGTYYWKSYANDSTDQWNTSDTWYFTINKANNNVNMYFNGTPNANRTYTYPDIVNASATTDFGTAVLYRDSVSIGGSEEQIRLGNGTYEYFVNSTGNTNYSDNTSGLTYFVFVNKGTINLNLSLNSTESNVTYTYPEIVYASGNKSSTINNEGNLSLWRDGSIVNTSLTLDEVSEIILLGVAEYNYSLTYTATNYSDISILTDRFAIINQGATNIQLFLNGTENNVTYTQYNIANFTAVINVSGESVSLISNYTGWSQVTNITSVTNTTNLTIVGYFNMTANYSATINYSSSFVTYFFNVTSGVAIAYVNWTAENVTFTITEQFEQSTNESTVNSTGSNSDVRVYDISGNGTFISVNQTSLGALADTENKTITFLCFPSLSTSPGYYERIFHVNSTEDTTGDNVTAMCNVISKISAGGGGGVGIIDRIKKMLPEILKEIPTYLWIVIVMFLTLFGMISKQRKKYKMELRSIRRSIRKAFGGKK